MPFRKLDKWILDIICYLNFEILAILSIYSIFLRSMSNLSML